MGTFLCGPEALGEVLAKKCAKYSDVDPRKTKFYFNKENFWESHPTRKTGTRRRFAVLDSDYVTSHCRQFPSTWPRLREAVNCYRVQGWLWRQRQDWAKAVHPKSLAFTVIWNYYPYLAHFFFCLRTKWAVVYEMMSLFFVSSWGTNSIQSNYVSPVKLVVTWFRTLLKSWVGDYCCSFFLFVNNVLIKFL